MARMLRPALVRDAVVTIPESADTDPSFGPHPLRISKRFGELARAPVAFAGAMALRPGLSLSSARCLLSLTRRPLPLAFVRVVSDRGTDRGQLGRRARETGCGEGKSGRGCAGVGLGLMALRGRDEGWGAAGGLLRGWCVCSGVKARDQQRARPAQGQI